MLVKANQHEQFDAWITLKNDVENRSELAVAVQIIAEQMEMWIKHDNLSEEAAFGRTLRDHPYLADKTNPNGIDTMYALAEFWELGDEFKAFVDAGASKATHESPHKTESEHGKGKLQADESKVEQRR